MNGRSHIRTNRGEGVQYRIFWKMLNIMIPLHGETLASGSSNTSVTGLPLLGGLDWALSKWRRLFWSQGVIAPGLGPISHSWKATRIHRHRSGSTRSLTPLVSNGDSRPGEPKEQCMAGGLKRLVVISQNITSDMTLACLSYKSGHHR